MVDHRPKLGLAVLAGTGAAGCGVALLATSGFLLSRAALHPPVLELMVAIVGVRAFALGRAVLRYAERLRLHDAALRYVRDVRASVFDQLEPLAPGALEGARSGDLLTCAVRDVETLQDRVIRGITPFAVAAGVAAGAVALTWWLLPVAAAPLAAGLLLALVAVPHVACATGRWAGRREARLRGQMSAGIVEAIQEAPQLSSLGVLNDRLGDIARADRGLRRLAARDAAVRAASAGAGTFVAAATGVAVLALGVEAVQRETLAGVLLAAVALAAVATFDAMAPLPVAAQSAAAVRAAKGRLARLAATPPPVTDPEAPEPLPAGEPVTIALRGVGVRHADGAWALRDIDLDLVPGKRVAVIGPSGAGKTTLANVLVRFVAPDAGQYTIGGVDVGRLAQDDVRGLIGLAAQDAYLFDTTIAENVRLARPDATDEEVAAALACARIGDWVASLPDGLATRVGEHGRQLSGGQRQRVALARVRLADPAAIVLDEPTADLDPSTADDLLAAVIAASAGKAVVLITHRLAGLDAFDEIVVLEGGRVVERGRWDELAGGRGLFQRLSELEADVAAVAAVASAG